MTKANKYNLLSAVAAGLAAFAAYLPLLGGAVMDTGAALPATGIVSPLHAMSLRVGLSLSGDGAWGPHLTNAVLHALNALLLFTLARLTLKGGSHWPALLAGLIFALHPANTEAVSWVQARAELIYTLPSLLAFISFVYWADFGRPAGLVLCFSFLLLSLIGSEKGVILAALLPLYAFVFSAEASGRAEQLKRTAAALALCALGVVGFYLLKSISLNSADFFVWKFSVREAGLGLGYYFMRFFLPVGLTFLPPLPTNPIFYMGALLSLASIGFLYQWKWRAEAYFLAWTALALLPSFFAITLSGSVLAEHHMYLPAAGFAMFAAAVLWRIPGRRAMLVSAVAVTAALAVLAQVRVTDWKDESRLLSGIIDEETGSYEYPTQASSVLTMLGAAEIQNENFEKARQHLLSAVSANPGNYMAYFNAGKLYKVLIEDMQRDGDEFARKELAREALAVLTQGTSFFPNYLYLQFNLGIWQVRNLEWDNAARTFRTVLELRPSEEMENASKKYLKFIAEVRRSGAFGYIPADELLLEGPTNAGPPNDIIMNSK